MPATTTVNRYDPVTGALRLSYVTDGENVYSRTAYDVDDTHSWQSYTINTDYWGAGQAVTSSIVALLDDGGSVTTRYSHFGALANYPIRYLETWTKRDSAGQVLFVEENWEQEIGRGVYSDIRNKVMVYDAGTGALTYQSIARYDGPRESTVFDLASGNRDYVVTEAAGGRVKAEDYDPATGLLDYVITRDASGWRLAEDHDAQGRLAYAIETFADGRQVARDYDPATGLLDYVITTDGQGGLLAEDYDAAGRLDYVIQRSADGRLVATDYDLEGQHPWQVYTITYNAAGQIESAIGI